MFWKKSKPSSQELEIVDNLVLSMQQQPERWNIRGISTKTKLSLAEIENSDQKSRTVNLIEISIDGQNLELTFNDAAVSLAPKSVRSLIQSSQRLIKEQVLRSMFKISGQS